MGIDATGIAAEIFGAASPASPAGNMTIRDARRKAAKAEKSASSAISKPVEVSSTHNISLEDRREMCQSPSWDAYSRRKKEKKEKEQADKEAKAKKRRLSKVPPPSPSSALPAPQKQVQQQPHKAGPYPPSSLRGLAQAQTDACMSDSNLARPRQQKERPASVLGLSSPDLPLPSDIPAAQQARGRSSSFSSLFRGRRPSIEQADSGFIGGIKLEQRRIEANQKELNEHAITSDDIAPPRPHTNKRSPSPLRIFAPRSESKDKHTRAYPPIAIKTSGKNQALLAPESPTAEDGMVSKWRARMGLKEKKDNKEKGQKLTKTPSAQKEETQNRPLPKSESAPVITSPTIVQKIHGPIDDEKMGLLGIVDPSAHPVLTQKSSESKQDLKDSNDHPEEAMSPGSETSYKTVPESPPPPPRRSSKRKSLISLGDATNLPSPQLSSHSRESQDIQRGSAGPPEPKRPAPLTPSQTMPAVQQRTRVDRAPRPASKRWSMSDPPSIPYDSLEPSLSHDPLGHSKRTLKEAAKAAFGRNGLPSPAMPAASSNRVASRSRSPFRGHKEHTRNGSANAATNAPGSKPARVLGIQEWRISAPIQNSPPNHSSEDSCSDDFRSHSEHGTPNSSRPQSERGVFPSFGDNTENKKAHDSGYTSAHPSPGIQHADKSRSNQPSPLELDPIQAAALKVMAAFPDVTPRRPGVDRRTSSDPNIASVKGKQPLQARDSSRPRPIKTAIEPVHDPESKSPPLRDLLMLKDESSVAAPWPATYLEAARKAAPTAPAPKAPKQNPSSPGLAASTHGSPSIRARQIPDGEPIAKMFVECCSCKYYHDMPSKLYEFMAHPQDMVTLGDDMHFAGSVSMTVKCPWCKHEMSTRCCAGLAAMVYVKERLH